MSAKDENPRLPSKTAESGSPLTAEEFLGLDLPEGEKWELFAGLDD